MNEICKQYGEITYK